jgi:hypothetical protein
MRLPTKPSQKLLARQSPPAKWIRGQVENPVHYLGFLTDYTFWWSRFDYQEVKTNSFGARQQTNSVRLSQPHITTDGDLCDKAKVEVWTWTDDTGFRMHIAQTK